MINDSGYFYSDEKGTFDTQYDISINSAGRYKLISQQRLETIRLSGRVDFQLLYVAKGSAYFQIGDMLHRLHEGSVALYYPDDNQYYRYERVDEPDIYWVHFTGSQVGDILSQLGFDKSGVYRPGPKSEFALLIQKMIQELQVKRSRYHAVANLYLKELIELLARHAAENEKNTWNSNEIVEKAIVDFHQSYHLPIQINDYARQLNISCCWFIRSFKRYTGVTPQRYITDIRISKAKELLYSSSLTGGEIAQIIGYTNPLYFSRIFKQMTGVSPQIFRKNIRQNG